ncbi:MAG: adenine deaminase [Tissierella sp.]|uniref:adenine deaminase n=1 Tax=Tissierella sp. TaxID=41274 RepID=UPI003F95EE76
MRTVQNTNELIDCGLGKITSDLVLKNIKLVNVYSKEIYESKIHIKNRRIVSTDPDANFTAKEEIDCKGLYALPGFIDGHMHYSSSMINPEAMAQVIVPKGTTTVCADFMEIANVIGSDAIDIMLEGANKLPYRIAIEVPTRVPTAPALETTGKVINVEETKKLLKCPETVSLGEVAPSKILQRTDDNIEKICSAINMGKVVNGHAVGCDIRDLSVYASAGVSDDHEAVEWEEALNRLRLGMHVMIREGSGARNLQMFVKNALEFGYGFENTSFCTDDKHINDIENEGHINHNVNLAIRLGLDPITAISMATINAAKYLRVEHDYGSISPGRFADIILCDSIEKIEPQIVYFEGKRVFEKDKMEVKRIDRKYPEWIQDTVHFKRPISPDLFKVKALNKSFVKVNIAKLVKDQIINKHITASLLVKDGLVMRDFYKDIMKFAICERHGKNGNVGVYFVQGFTLKKGALAYSMTHNHQNICVIGANDKDMFLAVNKVKDMKGGLVTVIDGEVIASMPLVIGGLISDEMDAKVIRDQLIEMNKSAKETGCTLAAPFMTLSFIGHPAIPELAPTDIGLVGVDKQEFIPLVEV